jgi:anti-sigma factor RsiW
MDLAAWIDGRTSASEGSMIVKHVARCPWCAAACSDVREAASVATLATIPPAHVVRAAMALVEAPPATAAILIHRTLRWTIPAAAAIAVSAGGYLVGRSLGPRPQEGEEPESTAAVFGLAGTSAADEEFFSVIFAEESRS